MTTFAMVDIVMVTVIGDGSPYEGSSLAIYFREVVVVDIKS